MTIERLKSFIEKMRIYSIIATVLILFTAISMGIMMVVDTKNSNTYMLIMLLFIVLLSISLEIMLQALRLRLKPVSYNNTSYTIYAGVFNYYIFKGEKEVSSRYDLHLLTPIILRYVDGNTLIEAKISPIIKKIELKIDNELIK